MGQDTKDNFEKWVMRGIAGLMFWVIMTYVTSIDAKLDILENRSNYANEQLAAQKIINQEVAHDIAEIQNKQNQQVNEQHSKQTN